MTNGNLFRLALHPVRFYVLGKRVGSPTFDKFSDNINKNLLISFSGKIEH